MRCDPWMDHGERVFAVHWGLRDGRDLQGAATGNGLGKGSTCGTGARHLSLRMDLSPRKEPLLARELCLTSSCASLATNARTRCLKEVGSLVPAWALLTRALATNHHSP
jgi:hypothetical protein